MSESSFRRLCNDYEFEDRGEIELKGKAPQHAYPLIGRLAAETPT